MVSCRRLPHFGHEHLLLPASFVERLPPPSGCDVQTHRQVLFSGTAPAAIVIAGSPGSYVISADVNAPVAADG